MFAKKTHVRIIDTDKMIIEKSFVAVPLPDGKMLIQHGNFEDVPDLNVIMRATLKKHVA